MRRRAVQRLRRVDGRPRDGRPRQKVQRLAVSEYLAKTRAFATFSGFVFALLVFARCLQMETAPRRTPSHHHSKFWILGTRPCIRACPFSHRWPIERRPGGLPECGTANTIRS